MAQRTLEHASTAIPRADDASAGDGLAPRRQPPRTGAERARAFRARQMEATKKLWLLEHPGYTLEDRARAMQVKKRNRYKKYKGGIPGRVTWRSHVLDEEVGFI